MSSPKKSASSSDDSCDCGFEASNKRHYESYWKGSADPRDRADDTTFLKSNLNCEILIDRQIAEIHHVICLGNAGKNGGKTPTKKNK